MFLADWLSRCNNLLHEWPANVIAGKVAEVLDDGEISELEARELAELLSKVIGGEPSEINLQPRATRLLVDESPAPVEFSDRSFCFTGKFQYADRKICQAETAERGGHIQKTVTLGLDYLVIGTLASRDWAHTNHGRKIESAVHNKTLGAETVILSEEQWAASLSN
jgi:NAD-dependent DNA ligase